MAYCLNSLALITVIISGAYAASLASLSSHPILIGADGINFDFTGTKSDQHYCLISDPSFHLNVRLVGAHDGTEGRSWVKAIGLLAGGHSLELRARSSGEAEIGPGFLEAVLLDGKKVEVLPQQAVASPEGATSPFRLENAGPVFDGDDEVETYMLTVGPREEPQTEILIRLKPEAVANRRSDDAFIHFLIDVLRADGLPDPHGVLGQTYRQDKRRVMHTFASSWNSDLGAWQVAGPNGEGYLDGSVKDYVEPRLLSAHCRMSRYSSEDEVVASFKPMNGVAINRPAPDSSLENLDSKIWKQMVRQGVGKSTKDLVKPAVAAGEQSARMEDSSPVPADDEEISQELEEEMLALHNAGSKAEDATSSKASMSKESFSRNAPRVGEDPEEVQLLEEMQGTREAGASEYDPDMEEADELSGKSTAEILSAMQGTHETPMVEPSRLSHDQKDRIARRLLRS